MNRFLFTTLTLNQKKIIILLTGILSCTVFSLWMVPSFWEGAPRFISGILMIFGHKVIWRIPSFLSGIFAIIIYSAVIRYRFISFKNKELIDIIQHLINLYIFAALFELLFGRMDKFLEGGITSILFMFLFTCVMVGKNHYSILGIFGLFIMTIINIFLVETVLKLSGFIGIAAGFVSFLLQLENTIKDTVQIIKIKSDNFQD